MGFICGLVRDPHLAEDIFQEVWIRLGNAVENGVEIADQAKWCRGVARNLILHHWRDQRRCKVLPDSRLLDQIELAFEECDSEAELWVVRGAALRHCVQSLPEKSRRILALRYEEGLPVETIAKFVRQSVDAVMKSLSRLRQRLAACVERRLESEFNL
jgi:RNA polymerase sigma-70 factor (ECF subfamily)